MPVIKRASSSSGAKIRNPLTGRMVKCTGAIGRALSRGGDCPPRGDIFEEVRIRQVHVWRVAEIRDNGRFYIGAVAVPGVAVTEDGDIDFNDGSDNGGEDTNEVTAPFLISAGIALRVGDLLRFEDPARAHRQNGAISYIGDGVIMRVENDGGHKTFPLEFD